MERAPEQRESERECRASPRRADGDEDVGDSAKQEMAAG